MIAGRTAGTQPSECRIRECDPLTTYGFGYIKPLRPYECLPDPSRVAGNEQYILSLPRRARKRQIPYLRTPTQSDTQACCKHARVPLLHRIRPSDIRASEALPYHNGQTAWQTCRSAPGSTEASQERPRQHHRTTVAVQTSQGGKARTLAKRLS